MPFFAEDGTSPDQRPSEGGSGISMVQNLCFGLAVGSVLAAARSFIQSKQASTNRKLEEMSKRLEQLEKKDELERISERLDRMEEQRKELPAADPPPGKVYIKCKDVELFMNYCLKETEYNRRTDCRGYLNAWSYCQGKLN